MRLNVCIFGIKELFGAVPGQILDDIDVLASPVITLAGVAFGVFIGKNAAVAFEYGFASKVLAGDQFEPRILPLQFGADLLVNIGINFGK